MLCAVSIAACSGGGSGSSEPPGPSPAAIDVSHDGTGGQAFGKSATDQLRRYQTFIADSRPSVTGVEVKIRKNSGTDYYNSLSVELYETDAQHRPATLLAMASLASGAVTAAFSVVSAPLSYSGLVSGKEYAVVLEQYNAFGANAGLEWCVKEVNAVFSSGRYDNGAWEDESGLGDGWMKVYVSDNNGTNPAHGSLDPGFGAGGIVTTSIGASSPQPQSIAVQPDGRIVTALFDVISQSGFILARYNSDGSPDATFNSTGLVTTPIGTSGGSRAVVIQPDGKIVAAGGSYDGSNNAFALARYNTDGSLDTTFHTTGTVTTPIGPNSYAVAVAVQPDGKIVALGDCSAGFALARYNTDGSLDTTFNSTGTVTAPFAYSNAHAVAIQPDGKIIAAGTNSSGFTLVRYNTNGSPDASFNSTGTVTTSIGMFSGATAVVLQPDGKIVAAGSSSNGSNYDFALVRYNSDGSLDSTLHSTGTVTTSIGTNSGATAVAIQPDGKIVAVGSSSDGSWSFALARYNTDGSLDTAWNSTGTVITAISTMSGATAAAIQPDGKIVAVGYSDSYAAAARYHQ